MLKALAMGAKAVFVGRPVIWGLACKVSTFTRNLGFLFVEYSYATLHLQGSDGVEKVLGILKEELKTVMMLTGL